MRSSLTNHFFTPLLIILFHLPLHASLQEDCNAFVDANLKGLRDSRSKLKRVSVPFAQTVEILEFIEDANAKHGTEVLTESPQFYDLLVDLCDIVNLQHPDFKARYDVFVEQWDGNDQKPFSLFSFDRIAQLFHFRGSLFDHNKTSWYRTLIADIVGSDLPALKGGLILIRDLDAVHKGLSASTPFLDELNGQLNQLATKTKAERAAEQKAIRRKAPPPRMRRLCVISAMAHDFLTLQRLEEASNLVLSINHFTVPQEREAFLAGMIKIGELSTNKNLSAFMKSFMPTIPWEDFVHCRDAIEHQDEHGFHAYFRGIVDGTDLSVDFLAWQKEMEILRQRVTDVKQKLWGDNPKAKFEEWLAAEMSNTPVYGVLTIASSPGLEKSIRDIFRQTPLFNSSAELWKSLLTGQAQITFDHLKRLREEWKVDSVRIARMPEGSEKERQAKRRVEDNCKAYDEAEKYLWERLKNEAIHLGTSEKDQLITTARNHFDIPDITSMALALLKMDQSFLTTDNARAFVTAALPVGIMTEPILGIVRQFKPQMVVTRLVRAALPFDNTRDMVQSDRRKFAEKMFTETATYLHDLSHQDQSVLADAMIRYIQIAGEFSGHKGNLTQNPIIFAGGHIEEFKLFTKEKMQEFYRTMHRIHLPTALRDKPASYLASVYTISVGYSALKGWVARETTPLAKEREALEKLRDGRNFIAHGDLFREMNGVDLADVQEGLLTDHLDHCGLLGLN